jgi:uncharacterized protein (UPF0548 family)
VPADDVTYDEVGATLGRLPSGYTHVRRSAVVGHGPEDFWRASEALLSWEVPRRAGLEVTASAPRAAVGETVEVVLRLGPVRFRAPCRVVLVVDEPTVQGFAYGTLPGHPEQGEELFQVRLAPDGDVHLDVVAFSRPARWFSRVGAPVARLVQARVTGRYLRALAA